jgi:uncharacterized membrane protein
MIITIIPVEDWTEQSSVVLWYLVGVYSSIKLTLMTEDITIGNLLLCLTIGGLFGFILLIRLLLIKYVSIFNRVIIKKRV